MTTSVEPRDRAFAEIGSGYNVRIQQHARARTRGAGDPAVAADDDLDDALRAAQAGDEKGFVTLWRALNPAVLRYLWVVAGDAAEDVASETWLQAVRDLPRFRGSAADFRGWLFRIARHRGIDERRLAGRRREDPADNPAATPATGAAARDAAVEVLEADGTAWALSRIADLPVDQAEAVMLRVVAGLDVAATALVLGKRAGAVRIATMRGLRRLAADPQVRSRRPATTVTLFPETAEEV
jgi:RNA polymerase sigma-70 factor (ECF subfamily)